MIWTWSRRTDWMEPVPTAFGDSLIMSTLSPHGACLLWEPGWIWLNAVSDSLIAGGFFATAFFVMFSVWRRRDFQFPWAWWSFGIYIMLCGVSHLLSVLTLWVPVY